MSAQPQPGSYREQDGQVLTAPGPNRQPHAQWRWSCRADREWEDYSVRAAWREAESVRIVAGGEAYARYHVPSEMLLIAAYGVLQTVEHLRRDCPPERRERVLAQVGGGADA